MPSSSCCCLLFMIICCALSATTIDAKPPGTASIVVTDNDGAADQTMTMSSEHVVIPDDQNDKENDGNLSATAALLQNGHHHHDHHDHHGPHNLGTDAKNYRDHLRPKSRKRRTSHQNGHRNGFTASQRHVPGNSKKLRRVEAYEASQVVQDGNMLQVLISDAIDWAQTHGLILRTNDHLNKSDVAEIAPFTLFPTAFPRSVFKQALDVQKAMQLLYFRITKNLDFLKAVHKDIINTDKVVQSFMKIVDKVHAEGIRQPITLFFQRSDYMLHSTNDEQNEEQQHYELKQIEVNGCALGGAGLATKLAQLHRRMLKKAGIFASKSDVPDNRIDHMTAKGLYQAWQVFGNPDAVLLFLVDTTSDLLQFDRRHIQYEFERLSHDQVDIVRLSLTECTTKLMLDPVDFSLRLVDDERVVAVVFNQVLMLGSSPSQLELDARLMIERSTAIKAPSLVFAMSHSKKVQQVLTQPGMVEQFFPDPSEAHFVPKIRETFAGLWGFDADQAHNEQLIQKATKHPERYVLKPIGEGCCAHFNYFDEKIPEKLAQLTPTELNDFILMERLKPKAFRNHFVRALREPMFNAEVNTELGIYGWLLGNMSTGQILFNEQDGHVFKSKLATENEGGICAGTGMIDTPYLVDNLID